MKIEGRPAHRSKMLAAFLGSVAATWAVRFVWPSPRQEERRGVVQVPGWFQGAQERKAAGAGKSAISPAQLLSVQSGLVKWPESGNGDDIAYAFADAWRKLRPSVRVSFYGEMVGEEEGRARQLFADWWKIDPDGALRFVSEPPGAFIGRGGMYLLPHLAARDPRKAWALADLVTRDDHRKMVRGEVMRAWANRAPEEALAFAAGLPSSQRLPAEASAIHGWAVSHAADALEWAAAQPDGWRRNELQKVLVRGVVESDPATLAAFLRSGKMDTTMVALVFMEKEDNGREPATRLARAAVASDPDPLGFCLWASEPRMSHLASAAWTALMEREGVRTAGDIARLATKVPADRLDAFCAALGNAAPGAGLTWALEKGAPLSPLATAWARAEPEAALAALRDLPKTPGSLAALRAAVNAVRDVAPVAVLEALASLAPPPDHVKEFAREMRGAVECAASVDPVRTLRILSGIPSATPEEVSTVLAVGAHRDPRAVAAVLAEYELPVTEVVAAEYFTRGWAVADPHAASEWVSTLPQGDLRDGGAAGLARTVAKVDPAGAFAWGLEIGEAQMRLRALSTALDAAAKAGKPLEPILTDTRLMPEDRAALRQHAATLTKP